MISIIVPVYNAKKYLNTSLDSIVAQEDTDLDIVLVDDGSTDGSSKICDEYAKKDSRIRVIHQKNAGVSAARNKGLSVARGEYVLFVDSDDNLTKDSVKVFKSYIRDDVQLILGGYRILLVNDIKERLLDPGLLDELQIAEAYIQVSAWDNDIFHSPWGKLFSMDIIRNENLRFDENIKCGEDQIFVLSYLKYVKKALCIEELVYEYNYRNYQSSMKRYFPDFARYQRSIYEAYRTYMEGKGQDDKVIEEGMWNVYFSFRYYLNYCNAEDAAKKLAEVYELFRGDIVENLPYLAGIIGEKYAQFVEEQQFETYAKTWKKENRKQQMKKKLKDKIKKWFF